jgi:hypothetical protein
MAISYSWTAEKILVFAKFKQHVVKLLKVGASPAKMASTASTCAGVAGFISFLSKIHFISVDAAVS